MRTSARNRLPGTITEVKLGAVMAKIAIRVGDNQIESVITRDSAEEMNLEVGDRVYAVIKSTEVMINKEDEG
jgi:molybdopterin-binding protein